MFPMTLIEEIYFFKVYIYNLNSFGYSFGITCEYETLMIAFVMGEEEVAENVLGYVRICLLFS